MQDANFLGTENIRKLFFKFSIPAIIGLLVSALYNIVDRIFIGRIPEIGNYAMTGVGLLFPMVNIILAFALLIGIGSTAAISIKLGQKRKAEAEKILGNAFTLCLLFSLALTILGLIFLKPLLIIFGATANTMSYAYDYGFIFILGILPNMVASTMNHPIRGSGDPKRAAFTMLVGAVLNIILCPIFIFGLNLGVRGAAIATIISQIVSAIFVLQYLFSGKSTLRLLKKNMRLSLAPIYSILSIGVSSFALQIAASIVSVFANNQLLAYGGDMAIGAMVAVTSVGNIFVMIIVGMNQGIQPITGFNYGAGNYQRVLAGLRTALISTFTVGVLSFGLIMLFPSMFMKLFNNDPKLLEYGIRGLRIYNFFLPTVSIQIIMANFFQHIGKAKICMALTLSRQFFILLPFYLILPLFFGLDGVWYAMPAADIFSFLITLLLFTLQNNKLRRAIKDGCSLAE